ncbi:MAG: glycosyltransferase family 4 protein [Campylobacterales bacterium]|nr:glycosyltransferase family 4 protein [Campylobacterales bacterium]
MMKLLINIVGTLDALESQIGPDIVFTVFGPSYWRPKARHLLGFADGWVYNPDSVAYDRLPLLKRFKMRLHAMYKAFYIKQDADYFMIETEDAKQKLSETIRIGIEKIYVVGNTCSSVFEDKSYLDKTNENYLTLSEKEKYEFRLVYIAHNHANKNISVIAQVLPLLEGYNVKFVLTLDEDSYTKIFHSVVGQDKIINVGPIPHKTCPSLYAQCDALFAPTLLETFSAAYPEAMKMEKPILTSNYSFATDVCGDAALYFDPLDPIDIAAKIRMLVDDPMLRQELVDKGKKRVQTFETARSRAEKYVALCEKLAKENKKGEK